METGIYRWFGYDLDAETTFKMIKNAGFDNVVLWWDSEFSDKNSTGITTPDLARKLGLKVENLHMPFLDANAIWESSAEADAVISEYIECAKACKISGVPVMVMHLTRGFNPPPCKSEGLDNIKKLLDACEKYCVDLALENLRRPEYIDYVIDNVNSKRLKLCYDAGHENCFNKTDMLAKYRGRLKALHLHDNDGTDDQHTIPGDGNINWSHIARRIKNTGYSGSVTLECANTGQSMYKNLSAEEFLEKAYKSAMHLSKLVEN